MQYLVARKKKLPKTVMDSSDEIREVSRFIYAHPELGSEEHEAYSLLVSKLRSHGIEMTENYLGMDTAFLGTLGKGDPKVAIFAEYDALPIGHACGHNLIAAWAYGVATALAKSKLPRGTLFVVGSPAEEGRGKYASSKAIMAEKLKEMGISAALSVHPYSEWCVGGGLLATVELSFVFVGRAAHTAASPEQGLNALDAAAGFYIQARMLRTMVRRDKDVIIGAIIVNGGSAPNVIPGESEVLVGMRSNDSEYVRELEEKVKNIAKGAASMTGCSVRWSEVGVPLSSMKRSRELEELCYRHALEYLPKVASPEESWAKLPVASSDVANVSQLIPTAMVAFKIGREGLPGHSEEWKRQAGTIEAEEALLTSVAIACDTISSYLVSGGSVK